MCTQEHLKEIFNYSPETGEFFVRVKRRGMRKAVGEIATFNSGTGYLYLAIKRKHWYAHRLAWLWVYGSLPAAEIDHINGVKTDNRIANLREATHSQNLHNSKLNKRNNTGFKGVRRLKGERKQYWAGLNVQKKQIFLGWFHTAAEAAAAYDAAVTQHLGKYAKTNALIYGNLAVNVQPRSQEG